MSYEDRNPVTPPSNPAADALGGATETDADACTLCELPTPSTPITDSDVEGQFCCQGCLEVTRALGSAQLDEAEAAAIEDALEGERSVDLDSLEGETAFFSVDGMHCSTCEAFLEGRATALDGVAGVEASYATDAIRLVYDPDVVEKAELSTLLSGVGYSVRERGSESESEPPEAALVKFLIGGGLFGMMIMLWYVLFLYPSYFGYDPIVEFGSFDRLYLFTQIWLLTTLVLGYTGYPILRGAYVSLRAGQPNMDLLVSIAAIAAYAYSTLAMIVGRTDLYFDVTVAVILVVTVGTYYEGKIKGRAAGLLSELTAAQVEEARRADTGEQVSVDAVEPGDRLLVKAGERVPFDGTILEGTAAIDQSLVTGESLPVERSPGDPVRGGTVVTDAPIVISVGEDAESTVDRLVELLWSIQSSRPGVQALADKLATIFVPLVILLATVATVTALLLGRSPTAAALIGLTVLIVSCPCALGLATPLAIASGVQTAAKRGIVVVAETIFEQGRTVDVVAFDKTGTLTSGLMAVQEITGTDGTDETQLLQVAAAVERTARHPIATAIVDAADEAITDADSRETPQLEAVEIESVSSETRGVTGVVGDKRVIVGHPETVRSRGWTLDSSLELVIEQARGDGDVPVVVAWEGAARGVIVVGDEPRPEWEAAINELSVGREIVVITGDEGATVDRFRAVDGVDQVFAGVPPEAKAETVRRLRGRGTVAMVGDGSNDAPALAAADVGIALSSGTKLATDAADAVIVSDNLRSVGETFLIAERTNRRIRQNLGWAFFYNAAAIPLAIAGLLNPLLAAVAMAISSLLVVLNSARRLL